MDLMICLKGGCECIRFLSNANINGNETVYEYDDRGNLVRTVYPDETEETAVYDAENRRVVSVDRSGLETHYGYDALGRLLETIFPNVADSPYTSTEYDAIGRVVAQYDENGNGTFFDYDPDCGCAGRRSTVTDALGNVTRFSYDLAGNQTEVIDASDHVTTFEYDELSRLTKTTFHDGTYTETTYDVMGRRIAERDQDGRIKEFAYDGPGRLVEVTEFLIYSAPGDPDRSDPDNVLQTRYTYTYDTAGHPAAATVLAADDAVLYAESFSYDERNRLAAAETPYGTLNNSGLRQSISESSGRTVSYIYDALNRLTEETVTGDPHSINGSIQYGYDKTGNRLAVIGNLGGTQNVTLGYDGNDRITGHTHDNNGNTVFADGHSDSYDFRNRLIRRIKADSTVIDLLHSAAGDRVAKAVGGNWEYYLTDRNNLTGYSQVAEVLQEDTDTAELTAIMVNSYGLDMIGSAQYDEVMGWESRYFLYDGLGSVIGLVDASGTVADSYTYSAYGELLYGTFSTDNNYLFTGEWFDDDLGMYFLRARHYAPEYGRFWTMDTYEGSRNDPVSLHKYLYANANPASYLDPTGNFSIRSLALTTAVIGTIVTMANVAITGTFGYRVATGGSAVPDGMMVTGGLTFGARGAITGLNGHLVTLKGVTWGGFSGEAGLDPTTLGKLNRGVGSNVSFSFLFGAKDISDLSGVGFTATWPVSVVHLIPRALLKALSGNPNNMKNIADILLALKRGKRQGGHRGSFRNPNAVVQFGLSGSSTAIMSFGARSNTFSTTMGFTSSFRKLGNTASPSDLVGQLHSKYGSLLSQKNAFASDPYSMFKHF